ncbi:hypothetical protein MKW92_040387, partial [Papaver armeniacum]
MGVTFLVGQNLSLILIEEWARKLKLLHHYQRIGFFVVLVTSLQVDMQKDTTVT